MATLASAELARTELSIRSVLADRESPYMATIFSKAESGEPLDEEDLYRATRTIIASIVRLRSDFTQRKALSLDLPNEGFASLRRDLEYFSGPARDLWASMTGKAPDDFVDWVESNISGLKR